MYIASVQNFCHIDPFLVFFNSKRLITFPTYNNLRFYNSEFKGGVQLQVTEWAPHECKQCLRFMYKGIAHLSFILVIAQLILRLLKWKLFN